MGRKLSNFLKFLLLIFPFIAYLIYFGCLGSSTFSEFLGMYFGTFNFFFEPIIESFIGETGVLHLVDRVAVTFISNLLGYFVVYTVVILIFDVFTFIPSIMARWLEKMKKQGD